MKKILIIALLTAAAFCMSSCQSERPEGVSNAQTTPQSTAAADVSPAADTGENLHESGKMLIAYFSFPETDGVDASAGASRVVDNGEVKGAMQYMAEVIQAETGADMFRIETVQEYPGSHEPLVDQASEELAADARPELSSHIENLDEYDTIFIGYPVWWGRMPMPLYSFFDEYDFSGKTVIPFSSHGGSGLSGTVEAITSLEPDANVEQDAFTVSRNSVSESAEDIRVWLREINIVG